MSIRGKMKKENILFEKDGKTFHRFNRTKVFHLTFGGYTLLVSKKRKQRNRYTNRKRRDLK